MTLVEKIKTFAIGTREELKQKVSFQLGTDLFVTETMILLGYTALLASGTIEKEPVGLALTLPIAADVAFRTANVLKNVLDEHKKGYELGIHENQYDVPGLLGTISGILQ